LVCKAYRISGKLSYPYQILPKRKYKAKIEIDSLLQDNSVFIVRRFDQDVSELFVSVGGELYLKETAISPKEIGKGLSLNLFGGEFKEEHLRFRVKLKSPGSNEWLGRNPVFLSDHINDYEVFDETLEGIYFNANNLHNQELPYNRNFDKKLDKELDDFFINIPSGKPEVNEFGQFQLIGRTLVTHEPILLNYWHVQFNVCDFQDNQLTSKKSGAWVNSLCESALKNLICVNAYKKEHLHFGLIERKHYHR
jgi:hypothetical protein